MTFSIIIPTFNRCDGLIRTLNSLARIDASPDDFEVILVDNGSTDQTRDAFDRIRAEHPKTNWRYFYEPTPGLLSGRHKGALESRGEICVFLDDDVRLGPDWLSALREAFQDPAAALVGGPSRPIFESNAPDWLTDFYAENQHGRFCGWLSLFDGGERMKDIDPRYIWGLNYAVRRQVLFDCGGFHPDCIPKKLQRYQGDGETGLSSKVKAAGLRSIYHPQASVLHEIPASRLTLEYFETRSFYQGVCDSYTSIRQSRAPRTDWIGKSTARYVRDVCRNAVRSAIGRTTTLLDRTGRSYSAGHAFHQRAVTEDPSLLAWVLKDDYWDYALPKGWESHLNNTVRFAQGVK